MAHLSKIVKKESQRSASLRVKATRGSEPTKLFNYLCSPEKQPQFNRNEILATGSVHCLIFCRTVPGDSVLELARNFRQIARLNLKVSKTVAHYSISLPHEDNSRVNQTVMQQISMALLERLGHARCPYFGVEHHDTKHRHWHLAASTINYSGEWISDSFDRYRLRKIESDLEIYFGLKQTPIRSAVEVRNLSTGEYRLKKRTKKLLPKEKLWRSLDECLPVSKSLARLVMELRVNHPEISVRLKEQQGQHVGISFEVDGVAFAGRKLGRAYSLNGLRRYHGVEHDDKSKALLDKILTLSHEECRALYEDIALDQPAKMKAQTSYEIRP